MCATGRRRARILWSPPTTPRRVPPDCSGALAQKEIHAIMTEPKLDVDAVAFGIVKVFPALNLFEQRLSLELYRLLSGGQPVMRAALAERLRVAIETIDRILDRWPGVFSDSERRIIGYWGLSIAAAYTSPHRLTIDGQRLSAWCAWDTLFLPSLLGKPAEVESRSPGLDDDVSG